MLMSNLYFLNFLFLILILFLQNSQDPAQLDLRVEAFLKMFESKLYAMSDDEFKVNVFSYGRLSALFRSIIQIRKKNTLISFQEALVYNFIMNPASIYGLSSTLWYRYITKVLSVLDSG